MKQNRLKSKFFWTTLLAQVIAMLAFLGIFEKFGITTDQVEQIAALVLQLFVAFGLLNNPTNATGF